jgi:fucose permease
MQKIGYKRGILVGLLTCVAGAPLFIPAASVRLYVFFLIPASVFVG